MLTDPPADPPARHPVGLLNVDKPPGLTSRAVVNLVLQRLRERGVRKPKGGHAGTLDPLATGVLVVAVGKATELIRFVQAGTKEYDAAFLLGRTSDTLDVDGEVVPLPDPPDVDRATVEAALPRFLDAIEQVPPAHSAVRVGGRRAYDLARGGRPPDLAPRPVRVESLSVSGYDGERLRLAITCGSGFYVRSLGRDLAAALGTGAVMEALVRRAVGPFRLTDAVAADGLTAETVLEHLRPPAAAVAGLDRVTVDEDGAVATRHGKPLPLGLAAGADGEVAIVDGAGRLVAVGERREGSDVVKPRIVFPAP